MKDYSFKFVAAYYNGGERLEVYTIVFLPNYESWGICYNTARPQGICIYRSRFVPSNIDKKFFLKNRRVSLLGDLPKKVQDQIKEIEEKYR